MSDLTGGGSGRAANGGARTTAGPVPVTQSDRSNIRTPQMIMNDRRQREAARRQTEADARAAEEQRKAEEERRRSAERRAQLAGVAGDTGTSRQPAPLRADGSQTSPFASSGVPRQAERRTASGPANPMPSQHPDVTSGAQYSRPRANTQTTQPQPAPAYQGAAPASGESRRPPPSQHARRPSAQAAQGTPAPAAAPPSQPVARQSTTSTFPHAFERWETLSSHWEGLTSYWIRRLEQNTEEVRREPLSQQMSRQITDLSAAGANLFHAVVELQRLRASSERKFQRWFYEHRQEQERAQEKEAQFDNMLRVEREARAEAAANMERMATEKKNAERAVIEMKRELQISKEEARRAWEELGRREQEERDRTFSLREGQPTLVGGVQVVPMAQGLGTHGSQHAQAGEEAYDVGPGSQAISHHYTYEEGQSPTDTDPFTEGGRHAGPLRHEPDAPSLAQGTYVPSGAASSQPASSHRPSGYSQAPEQQSIPVASHMPPPRTTGGQQSSAQPSTSRPEAFYQQPEVYLHRDTASGLPEDERSYVASHGDETSEGDEEYAIDERGNFILDEAGHRVPYRSLREHDSDEFDVQEDRRRELEHLQHYGTAPQSTSSYTTTTSAGPSYAQHYPPAVSAPDYSGSGYGDEWSGMRHHHPTRLSDVLEEDERSRTSPSRASQASRGFH